MTFCSVFTHSFALATLSALKKYFLSCVVTQKAVESLPCSLDSDSAADTLYVRSMVPLGKYRLDGSA